VLSLHERRVVVEALASALVEDFRGNPDVTGESPTGIARGRVA
jgi:hypothetical protein